jgi:hypothetical protein
MCSPSAVSLLILGRTVQTLSRTGHTGVDEPQPAHRAPILLQQQLQQQCSAAQEGSTQQVPVAWHREVYPCHQPLPPLLTAGRGSAASCCTQGCVLHHSRQKRSRWRSSRWRGLPRSPASGACPCAGGRAAAPAVLLQGARQADSRNCQALCHCKGAASKAVRRAPAGGYTDGTPGERRSCAGWLRRMCACSWCSLQHWFLVLWLGLIPSMVQIVAAWQGQHAGIRQL